jgi:hypothetical protein
MACGLRTGRARHRRKGSNPGRGARGSRCDRGLLSDGEPAAKVPGSSDVNAHHVSADVGSLGGDGGDAGRGVFTAASGTNGVDPSSNPGGTGGTGASPFTAGAGGTGNGAGQPGGSSSVPGTTNGETTLGVGGLTQNTTSNGGGNGGCGYYGGGSGGGGFLEGAGGGGGGGSSFVNLNRLVPGSASKAESLSRSFDLGPSISVYW